MQITAQLWEASPGQDDLMLVSPLALSQLQAQSVARISAQISPPTFQSLECPSHRCYRNLAGGSLLGGPEPPPLLGNSQRYRYEENLGLSHHTDLGFPFQNSASWEVCSPFLSQKSSAEMEPCLTRCQAMSGRSIPFMKTSAQDL